MSPNSDRNVKKGQNYPLICLDKFGLIGIQSYSFLQLNDSKHNFER